MKVTTKIIGFKDKLLDGGGSTSGVFGAIGSIPNVCHSLCMSIVSILAVAGITISILPLMFLQTYRLYFWMAAFLFTAASFYFFRQQTKKSARDKNFLFINTGLLVFGLPFSQVSDYMDFFRFIGLGLVACGLFLLFFEKKLKFADQLQTVPAEAVSSGIKNNADALFLSSPAVVKFYLPKFKLSSVLLAIVVGVFLMNQYLMYRINGMGNSNPLGATAPFSVMGPVSQMKMTAFDIALAKERMDKNNDGICDTCGMPMQQCIDSGQMDCNMGNNPAAIGILGSQHVHADLAVYVDGQKLILAKPENFVKSMFLHLDNNQNQDDANSVLHQHAKKTPLWLFFRSLGMNLANDSLTLADGRILKNENGKSLKFYLDGKKVDELTNYSFQSLDKLLISYGPVNDSDIQVQIDSVTDFAKNHK